MTQDTAGRDITRAGSRWTSFAANVVMIVVSLVAVAFIVPAALGLQRYVIAGSSMTGTIDLGSVAFEKVVPTSDLRVGDVITYLPPAESGIDHLVTHRIHSIKGNEYRTKGDANADVDPWTFKLTAATQPRVAFHVPYVGWAFLALQQRSARLVVIGIPAAIVFFMALAELVGGLRRRGAHDDADEAVEAAPVSVGPVVQVIVPRQADATEAATPRVPRRRRGTDTKVTILR